MLTVPELLGPGGRLAGVIGPGYEARAAQLALVIVDRVPFTPSGAVQLAKQAAIAAQGGGRLIRTTTDRGVVALLDQRLTGRPWGRTVLNALPPLRITRACEVAVQFLRGALCLTS